MTAKPVSFYQAVSIIIATSSSAFHASVPDGQQLGPDKALTHLCCASPTCGNRNRDTDRDRSTTHFLYNPLRNYNPFGKLNTKKGVRDRDRHG